MNNSVYLFTYELTQIDLHEFINPEVQFVVTVLELGFGFEVNSIGLIGEFNLSDKYLARDFLFTPSGLYANFNFSSGEKCLSLIPKFVLFFIGDINDCNFDFLLFVAFDMVESNLFQNFSIRNYEFFIIIWTF